MCFRVLVEVEGFEVCAFGFNLRLKGSRFVLLGSIKDKGFEALSVGLTSRSKGSRFGLQVQFKAEGFEVLPSGSRFELQG